MDFLRFSCFFRALSDQHSAARAAARALALGGVCLISYPAAAQKAPPAAPVAPAPLPTAPGIGILLLAIDELPAPGGIAALPPAPDPADPGAVAPGAITPAAITPAQFLPRFQLQGQPFWIAAARKKPKDKNKKNEGDPFTLTPDYNHRGIPGAAPPASLPTGPVAPDTVSGGAAPTQLLGRAHTTAITLRSALLALGWADVSLATPNTGLVSDALTSRRLTPRALDALKVAFADIAAPGVVPTAASTARAARAATRIGQTLGYRAVVVLYVSPATVQNGTRSAAFSVFLGDSARESGEPILFDETGDSERNLSEAGASTAAALLDKSLRTWPDAVPADRAALAAQHLAAAKTLIAAGQTADAQDELNQSIALDASKSEALVLLGDLLAPTDTIGAASAYRRAVELDSRDGATLAKIAISYAYSPVPDRPRALEAGRKAILAGFDSAPLRVAMATVQYDRADLLRQADRLDKADEAEADARAHLDRALELSPDDPSAVRLLARRLVESRHFNDAVQTLDRVAPRYPTDLEIQTQYAAALAGVGGRSEDAFVAQSRVWKLSGQTRVDVDAVQYRALAQGFDIRLYNIGKSAVQLTGGVANAALPREDALIQLTKLKEDMADADTAINSLRVPASVGLQNISTRQFASSLMTQALEQEQLYLETGQSLARLRGAQLYTQAVDQLNSVRGGG